MNHEEALRAVGDRSQAVARSSTGDVMGRGRVVAYSMVPTLLIEREDGSRFSWRHDMVGRAEACMLCGGATDVDRYCSTCHHCNCHPDPDPLATAVHTLDLTEYGRDGEPVRKSLAPPDADRPVWYV